ncbi:MAG TPA: sugar phosphate isomerase/epimerase [Terriglobales bacterium]|nr:sugar phosphate isomerase/epimerase [Terriglobales bacterium]
MLSRRDFLRAGTAAIASIATNRHLFAGSAPHPRLGVQLYTVRKQAETDLPALLRQIRTIGYDEVETYWNVYSHPAAELRKMILDAGLKVPSGHFDYKGLPDKFDYATELGVKFVVCPMLPENMRNSLNDFRRAADQFNAWGERANNMGMRFGFHNHNYEFRRLPDSTGFDTLVARTDPKLVCFEIDCYWVTQAGQDPVAILQRLGNRVRLLHLKDRSPGFPPSQELNKAAEHFTEVGNGSIDWRKILAAAEKLEVEHLFVEQDESERPPLESLRISYRNLTDMYLAKMSFMG